MAAKRASKKPAKRAAKKPAAAKPAPKPKAPKREEISSDLRRVALAHALRRLK